ncbi:XAP5 domain-containing protein [Cryptosporidium felis]|nr:XAP5 domain-containing protein [Cryptosporidium felis]
MKSIYEMFTSKTREDEEQFRSRTIGLVSAEAYKRHKSSIFRNSELETGPKKSKRDPQTTGKQENVGALSFSFGEEGDDIEDESNSGGIFEGDAGSLRDEKVVKSGDFLDFDKIGKDTSVDTTFLPDKKRELEELKIKERLEMEEFEKEEKLKQEIIEVVFSYWDGSGHRRSVNVPRNTTIGEFLEKCRIKLKSEFKEFSRLSSASLMYIKEDVILPHTITFHELIKSKARGKTGPLFHFNVFDDIRAVTDVRKETTEFSKNLRFSGKTPQSAFDRADWKMSTLSAVNFFSERITGFDSENAPFMAFKELFDNSIDACNKNIKTEWKELGKKIQVLVNFENLELDEHARVCIVVRDTGCGIPLDSIDLLGTLFGTSKKVNKRDSYYTGQFGMGLKMTLLYATQHGGGNIKVKMRMGEKIWKFDLLCNLSDGSFFVGNSESFECKDWGWVTEFSVSMKLDLNLEYLQENYFSMELFAKSCLKKIQSYLFLSKIWNEHISINFETNLSQSLDSWRNGDIILSFENIFKENYVQIANIKGSKYKINSVFGFIQPNQRVTIKSEFQGENEEKNIELNKMQIQENSSLKSGYIYIYRFSNGMPIISKEAETCEIVASVKSFIKKKGTMFGMKLGKREEVEEFHPVELSIFNGSEFLLPIMVIPNAEFRIRVLIINVKSHGIQYGSLGKSCLRSNTGISGSIHQTLMILMKRGQLQFPGELMNLKDFGLKNSIEIYSPIIAKSLASMVIRSDSIIFKKGLHDIFSKCDPESSEKLSLLLGNDEEKLKENFDLILSKYLLGKIEQKGNSKNRACNPEVDSDDYKIEEYQEYYDSEKENVS